ncbi:hypothetical protein I316_07821 [Kwoniella heveanensis BCC8398]|uniref:Uncharacterized protein n=1 Tax=Kwoniella heveanensis BCC8398 TaxID=1296120 RepID=A0A1B9GHU8_9TREE|nr:hypothetical protein I316_07821 [Kwoniella heveanensis BCC8398]
MFAPLAPLLPFLASTSFGVQAVALAGGKARLSPREDGQYGIAYSRIHPKGDESLCLTVQGGEPKAGDVVHISQCFGDGDPYESAQTWSIPTLDDNAEIKLSSSQNQDLCLSSG